MLHIPSERQQFPKHNNPGSIIGEHLGFRLWWEKSLGLLGGDPPRATTTDAFLLNLLEKSLSVPSDQWAAENFTPKNSFHLWGCGRTQKYCRQVNCSWRSDRREKYSLTDMIGCPNRDFILKQFHLSKYKNLKQWWRRLGFLFWLSQLTWKGISVQSVRKVAKIPGCSSWKSLQKQSQVICYHQKQSGKSTLRCGFDLF